MKKLTNLVATFALAGIILMSSTAANAGFLVSDFRATTDNNPTPCTQTEVITDVNYGIIVSGFTGIIVSSITTIINDVNTPINDTNCGFLLSD